MRSRTLLGALAGAAAVLGTGGATVAAEQSTARATAAGGVAPGRGVGVVFSGGLARAYAEIALLRARARVTHLSNTTSPPIPPLRYRPVGCVARGGAVAHFNGPARKEVALTFDDGPSTLTLQFVRMLRAEHVKATFFLLGNQLSERYRKVLAEELRDGDVLGDHTWSHPDLVGSGEARSQLSRTKRKIASLSGYTPCVFRPPYGAFDSTVLRTAHSLGLATIVWSVDPRDWALPGVGAIESTVPAQVKPGSIVLSHDGGGPRGETLAAYPHIIAALRRRGYTFVTVPQLLGFHGIYRRCRRDCGEAQVQEPLPRGSIVQGG